MVSHAACMIWHSILCNHTGKCKHAGHYICLELYYYRTAFHVGRLLIRVVTPRNITDDLLRILMIKNSIDYL